MLAFAAHNERVGLTEGRAADPTGEPSRPIRTPARRRRSPPERPSPQRGAGDVGDQNILHEVSVEPPVRARTGATVAAILACDTCAGRWDEGVCELATRLPGGECPLCSGELRDAGAVAGELVETVHSDGAQALCERLLGVGA